MCSVYFLSNILTDAQSFICESSLPGFLSRCGMCIENNEESLIASICRDGGSVEGTDEVLVRVKFQVAHVLFISFLVLISAVRLVNFPPVNFPPCFAG